MSNGPGRLLLVIGSILFLFATGVSAQGPPSQIKLSVPPGPASAGETVELKVELLGVDGQPRTAASDMSIALEGLQDLMADPKVKIAAGQNSATVKIKVKNPGFWQIRAKGKGLRSDSGMLAAPATGRQSALRTTHPRTVADSTPETIVRPVEDAGAAREMDPPPRPRASRRPMLPRTEPPPERTVEVESAPLLTESQPRLRTEEPNTRAEATSPEPVVEPEPERVEPTSEAVDEGAEGTASDPSDTPRGRVTLIAEPTPVHRHGTDWPAAEIAALWTVDDLPVNRETSLNVLLRVEKTPGEHELNPRTLVIPAGEFISRDPVDLVAHREGGVELVGVYPNGSSIPLDVDFLPADPAKLVFPTMRKSVRGLANVVSKVYVSLLGDDNEPAETNRDLEVYVQLTGSDGAMSTWAMTIPSGKYQHYTEVVFPQPGTYSLRATAPDDPNLAPDEVTIAFELAWILACMTLAGGLLGAAARLLFLKSAFWPGGVVRALVLGTFAAVMVVLMRVFGVLGILSLPQQLQEGIEKIPVTNVLGALLIGIVAGLFFEGVYSFITFLKSPQAEGGQQAQAGPSST